MMNRDQMKTIWNYCSKLFTLSKSTLAFTMETGTVTRRLATSL